MTVIGRNYGKHWRVSHDKKVLTAMKQPGKQVTHTQPEQGDKLMTLRVYDPHIDDGYGKTVYDMKEANAVRGGGILYAYTTQICIRVFLSV